MPSGLQASTPEVLFPHHSWTVHLGGNEWMSTTPPPHDCIDDEDDNQPIVSFPMWLEWVKRSDASAEVSISEWFSGLVSHSTLCSPGRRTLPQDKQSQVVYRIPCSCGKVYIGETVRSLETRLKEHQKACREGTTATSAVTEHMHKHQHPTNGRKQLLWSMPEVILSFYWKRPFTSAQFPLGTVQPWWGSRTSGVLACSPEGTWMKEFPSCDKVACSHIKKCREFHTSQLRPEKG